jgi:hypothetical protein
MSAPEDPDRSLPGPSRPAPSSVPNECFHTTPQVEVARLEVTIDAPEFISRIAPRLRPGPFAGSVVLHLLVFSLFAARSEFAREEWQEPLPRTAFHVLETTTAPLYFAKRKEPATESPKKPVPPSTESGARSVRPRPFDLPKLAAGDRTLVQLDVPPRSKPPEKVQVPDVLVWAREKNPTQNIVPGASTTARPSNTPPVLDLAAPQLKPADLAVMAPPVIEIPKLPALRAASTPMRVATPEPDPGVPSTSSQTAGIGHIISVSDAAVTAETHILVPAVNQTASGGNSGAAPGTAKGEGLAQQHEQVPAATGGASQSPEVTGKTTSSAAPEGTPQPGLPKAEIPKPVSASVSLENSKISRPVNGRHSSVVMGTGASAAYPESAGILTGKVVYTVYLQLGLRKNWVMQFCLVRDTERGGSVNGAVAAVDPPWPFTMVRPAIDGLKGDYTLVHAIVNTNGRFEQFSLVIPDEAGASILWESLRQWEFRPASRGGSVSPVEVLLIIPHPRE